MRVARARRVSFGQGQMTDDGAHANPERASARTGRAGGRGARWEAGIRRCVISRTDPIVIRRRIWIGRRTHICIAIFASRERIINPRLVPFERESSREGNPASFKVANRPRVIDPLSRETIIAAIIRPRACSLERAGCRVKAAHDPQTRVHNARDATKE
jgi:hypothetical protein